MKSNKAATPLSIILKAVGISVLSVYLLTLTGCFDSGIALPQAIATVNPNCNKTITDVTQVDKNYSLATDTCERLSDYTGELFVWEIIFLVVNNPDGTFSSTYLDMITVDEPVIVPMRNISLSDPKKGCHIIFDLDQNFLTPTNIRKSNCP